MGREERRQERRDYEADVYFDVWRSGRDPEAIDFERVDDARYEGLYPDEAAAIEIKLQRQSEIELDQQEQPQ